MKKRDSGIERELRERICKKCEFYEEGEALECGAFKISKKLVKEGKINLEDL